MNSRRFLVPTALFVFYSFTRAASPASDSVPSINDKVHPVVRRSAPDGVPDVKKSDLLLRFGRASRNLKFAYQLGKKSIGDGHRHIRADQIDTPMLFGRPERSLRFAYQLGKKSMVPLGDEHRYIRAHQIDTAMRFGRSPKSMPSMDTALRFGKRHGHFKESDGVENIEKKMNLQDFALRFGKRSVKKSNGGENPGHSMNDFALRFG